MKFPKKSLLGSNGQFQSKFRPKLHNLKCQDLLDIFFDTFRVATVILFLFFFLIKSSTNQEQFKDFSNTSLIRKFYIKVTETYDSLAKITTINT